MDQNNTYCIDGAKVNIVKQYYDSNVQTFLIKSELFLDILQENECMFYTESIFNSRRP